MNNNFSPDIIKKVSSRIDYLRVQYNLSIRVLARKSGISQSTLAEIIQGKTVPNVYTLSCICKALGIYLSDFFDFDYKVIRLRGNENILIKIYPS